MKSVDTKVVSLELVDNSPDPRVIELLTSLLEEAKAGSIHYFCFHMQEAGGDTHHGWAGECPNPLLLLGQIEALKHDLIRNEIGLGNARDC